MRPAFIDATFVEQASRQLKSILEHGTPQQVEAVFMTLRVVAMIKPGKHGARHIERAVEALRSAMS